MEILGTMRRSSFWALDTLKGRKLGAHVANIREILSINSKSEARNRELLDSFLKHAVDTAPFYAYLKGYRSINEFPVLDKAIIRANFDGFISADYAQEELLPVITSGSTGTPFKVFQNRDKKRRNWADTLYFANEAGYVLGEELYYLKIWSDINSKSDLTAWMQNLHPVDVIKLDNRKIAELIKNLRRNKAPKHLLGYSSALEQVALFLDKEQPDMSSSNVKSIITMSESLNDYTKDTLQKYFNIVPCSRYSNSENGILAQQLPHSGRSFKVNSASYYLEIFDMEKNVLAKPGELGRIVVTDFFNYGMPIIRYDTGDIGSMPVDAEGIPDNAWLNRIEGRKLDALYDTNGNIVSSYIMYKNMWKYLEITQYQLIQEDEKRYRFKINAEKGFTREQQLRDEFLEYLGNDATFIIEYVDEIPVLASGKRRKVVNLMKSK